jgi:hypothetical protein
MKICCTSGDKDIQELETNWVMEFIRRSEERVECVKKMVSSYTKS